MRTVVVACYALFLCFYAEAQIERGKILASGSLGFSAQNYKEVYDGTTEGETKRTNLWFSPKGGYFITDAIVVGAGISISSATTKFDDDDKYKSTSISFVPFARYYLPQGLFGHLEFGPGNSKDKWLYDDGDEEEYKYTSFTWSVGAGYAYFLNDHVAVEPMVSYQATTYSFQEDTDLKDKYGTITFQISFSIFLDSK
jgi:hypothetical protein